MGRNPYERVHPKGELSVEINFRSFLAGEGDDFFEPVPVEDMVDFASVGVPITIPEGTPYSKRELKQIAKAVRRGGGTLTLVEAASYPPDLVENLEKEAPGLIRLA